MRLDLQLAWTFLVDTPVLWLSVTLFAYLGALWVYRRSGGNPLLLPVLTAVIVVVAALLLTGTPYPAYAASTELLFFLIGPATVALAVPLYNQFERLKQLWWPVTVALLAGSLAAILSSIGIAWALGASFETMLSLAPKSATMPIAMEVADMAGGLPSFTTVAVALTGISAAMLTGGLSRLLRIEDPAVEGFALGLAGHAIGTSQALKLGETAGAFAALAMGLNGIVTAVLVPLILAFLY